MKTIKPVILLLTLSFMASCIGKDFGKRISENANQKFGDQHFKTAIALIELHKVREGEYPSSLDSLKYLGDWDKAIFSSVKYTRLNDGYELDLINGWIGKPKNLKYPPEFWKGLGLVKSNLK